MKIDFIPFQLGMQYENWEFTLDVLPDRLKGYDSYLNLEESLNRIFNFKSDRTEVIFNFDILEGVLFTFENRTQTFYKELKGRIFSDLEATGVQYRGSQLIDEDYTHKVAKCVWQKNKNVYLLYCNKSILTEILYSIF